MSINRLVVSAITTAPVEGEEGGGGCTEHLHFPTLAPDEMRESVCACQCRCGYPLLTIRRPE